MNSLKREAVLVILLVLLPLVCSIDSDRDGIQDEQDLFVNDFDNDGMPDSWEVRNGLRYDISDALSDLDGDGLSNIEEYQLGTDPSSADTDGDEIEDFQEVRVTGTDPSVKDKTIWPLVVFPILIIIGVVLLFLFEKYKLDLIIKSKWEEYFSKKEIKKIEHAKTHLSWEKPEIIFRSINQQQKEKEEQKEKIFRTFSATKDKQQDNFNKRVMRNKLNQLPKEVEGLVKPIYAHEKKDAFETKKNPSDFSSHQKPSVFEKLKRIK